MLASRQHVNSAACPVQWEQRGLHCMALLSCMPTRKEFEKDLVIACHLSGLRSPGELTNHALQHW